MDEIEQKFKNDSLVIWAFTFFLTHIWWAFALPVFLFCQGTSAMGYSCVLPIEGLAGAIETSFFLLFGFVGLFAPIIFWIPFLIYVLRQKRKTYINNL